MMNFLPLGHGSFGINTNLLETNILNLAVVIGVLVYFGGDVLTSLLTTRKEVILKSLNDAEERYQEATAKLAEAKEQLALATTKAEEIRAQGLITAEQGSKKSFRTCRRRYKASRGNETSYNPL